MESIVSTGIAQLLGKPYTTAVDDQGNCWVRTTDVADAFDLNLRAFQIRIQKTIRLEWRAEIKIQTAGGMQTAQFINQYAIVKLAGTSRNDQAQRFADEVIELGVKVKRGDLTLLEQIVDRHTQDETPREYERANFVLQRELAKTSNKLRNAEIEARTTSAERRATFARLSDDVNLVTTGKKAGEIKRLGKVQHTRDALAPAHLALQRFVELRETDMMRLHDAEGYNRIRGVCQDLHERVADMAEKDGLFDDRLIRDRRYDVKDLQNAPKLDGDGHE